MSSASANDSESENEHEPENEPGKDRVQRLTLDRSRPGERLDAVLRETFPAVSRVALQRLIEQGHVKVNGRETKGTYAPKAGDEVEVYFPEARPMELKPAKLALEILHEDRDLVVLNKPAGLLVHPASGEEEVTLVHALLHHCKGKLSGIGGVERPGIVHRLDKDTSGCMVVAKNDEAHHGLSDQFKDRTIHKLYVALTCGVVPHDAGEIRAALARHPNHRMTMVVDEEEGREAWTSFRVTERMKDASWVEATIHTGRTHQIRVHFKHIGYPLVGDELYGKRQNQKLKDSLGGVLPRQMLHAHRLSFTHPRTGKTVAVEAAVPEDFRKVAERLRGGSEGLD